MTEINTIEGINYGPLALLIGKWEGNSGVDRVPEPDGEERNPYYETIDYVAAGDVTNAEEQTLAIVRYHQVVSRKSNDKVFHDQVGYWTWDSSDNTIVHTFIIPRGVAVVAEGVLAAPSAVGQELVFDVSASVSAPEPRISQSSFMLSKAKTMAFTLKLTVKGDEMQYSQNTVLDIYGKSSLDHTDLNTLQRVS